MEAYDYMEDREVRNRVWTLEYMIETKEKELELLKSELEHRIKEAKERELNLN